MTQTTNNLAADLSFFNTSKMDLSKLGESGIEAN